MRKDEFWTAAAGLYGPRKDLLLALQDDHDAVVNVILLLLWLEIRGQHMTTADWHRVRRAAETQEQDTLKALRKWRRRQKGTQAYTAALSGELAAERAMQAAMLDAIVGPLRGGAAPAMLNAYLRTFGVPESTTKRLRIPPDPASV